MYRVASIECPTPQEEAWEEWQHLILSARMQKIKSNYQDIPSSGDMDRTTMHVEYISHKILLIGQD